MQQGAIWSNTKKVLRCIMKKDAIQYQKSAMQKKVQYEKSATRKKGAVWKKHVKSATWKNCNSRWVQHEKSSTRNKCNMKQHEKRCKMKRLQHTKRCNMKRVYREKIATWTSATRKKPDVYCFGDVIPFIKMLSRGRDRGQIFGLFKRTYFMYGHYSNIGQNEKSATRKSGTLNVYNT